MGRLDVFLIRPTKYDDEGYILRHRRGVLPSNTLACLAALTRAVRLPGVDLEVHLCDESVQAIPERRIRRAQRRRDTRALICLVGVQTNQFPRAADLTRRFRMLGLDVLVGGFHVSGTLVDGLPASRPLRELLDQGATLVAGEVDAIWGSVLADAAAGRLAPFYDSLATRPDLWDAPVPSLDPELQRRFVYRHFGTVDTSRGCPFTCSFCTITAVQGRRVRSRSPAGVAAAIGRQHRATETSHFFLTDDDLARNPHWREVFQELVQLRREAGVRIRFLMQVDLRAHRLPEFVALARAAGCFQVFLGLESLDPRNLSAAGKRQNRVDEYAAAIAAWRRAGVLVHVGYIIGFPHDTPEAVRVAVRALQEEVRPDVASFFIWTPLAGSADHRQWIERGAPIDADLNRHDTFQPVVDHPHMDRQTWLAVYREAWERFYSAGYLRRRLADHSGEQRTTLLQLYLWYLASLRVDRAHPMMTGFFRVKPRTDRRPGFAVEGRARHALRRVRDWTQRGAGYLRVLRTAERLWADSLADEAQAQRAASWPTRAWQEVRLGAQFLRAMY